MVNVNADFWQQFLGALLIMVVLAGIVLWLLTAIIASGVRRGIRLADADRAAETGEVSPSLSARPGGFPVEQKPQRFRLMGKDPSSMMDVEEYVHALSPAEAKAEGMSRGIIVTAVERA